MSYKNILVTGGAGYIGSHLIYTLAHRFPGASITSLDNYFLGRSTRHVPSPNVHYLRGHTKNLSKIWGVLQASSPDIIFHLGEYSRIPTAFDDEHLIWDYNTIGTHEILQFARKHGSKLMYSGSSSIFGNQGDDRRLNPYSASKAANCELIRNWGDWYGLEYVICYFHNVYGPRLLSTGRYAGVIGRFMEQYRRGLPLTVVAPGTQTRDFTHIDDTIAGIVDCATHGSGDDYLIGTGKEHSMHDVAQMFEAPYGLIPPQRGERAHGRADNRKVRSLGWKPRHDLPSFIHHFTTTVRKTRQIRKDLA
ncbi:NAD-dependent epimerase/dehydratase family protein [Haloglycomyces albus]|uniref:NAD-dependent epimerase/dehydratase family protein n=1 Tax=Haloglycomyces albus TaxID=526067 RepID=UPI00046CAF21|nr:NAD-dependent epimerase/dehydratase family protein [Haloglycomyces albus]